MISSKNISEVFTNNIFQKRKLNISSCIFPRNPTKKIPAASPICPKISLLDSLEVLEYFSKTHRKITQRRAKIIPKR